MSSFIAGSIDLQLCPGNRHSTITEQEYNKWMRSLQNEIVLTGESEYKILEIQANGA